MKIPNCSTSIWVHNRPLAATRVTSRAEVSADQLTSYRLVDWMLSNHPEDIHLTSTWTTFNSLMVYHNLLQSLIIITPWGHSYDPWVLWTIHTQTGTYMGIWSLRDQWLIWLTTHNCPIRFPVDPMHPSLHLHLPPKVMWPSDPIAKPSSVWLDPTRVILGLGFHPEMFSLADSVGVPLGYIVIPSAA